MWTRGDAPSVSSQKRASNSPGCKSKASTGRPSKNSTTISVGKWIAYALILPLWLLCSRALATEPPSTPVAKGEAAPFAGQLLSTERAVRLWDKAERCQAETKIEIETLLKQTAAALANERRKTEIERERGDEIKAMAERNAEKADSLWSSPVVVASGTVIGTLALVALTAWSLGQIDEHQ